MFTRRFSSIIRRGKSRVSVLSRRPRAIPSAIAAEVSAIESTTSYAQIPVYSQDVYQAIATKLLSQRGSEFLTPAEARQVHVLRGFSAYHPPSVVIDAVRARVNSVGGASHFSDAPSSEPDHPLTGQHDSFFILDLGRVRYKNKIWNECFPNVKAHYAVKANPNPVLLRLMSQDLQLNFDCASQSEIEAVLSLGVSPNRIVYANPCKPLSHIEFARRNGVSRTTFDSESELHKIKSLGRSEKWDLILRIWVDDKDAQCQLSNKYGAHLNESLYLLSLAKNLGLRVSGVSFHVGSGAKVSAYGEALKAASLVFRAGLELQHPMRLLDIGGGYPGTCSTTSKEPSLAQISQVIRPELRKHFQGVELIAEPGRFFCAEAQTLATQVIGKRVRVPNSESAGSNGNGIREYYVNDGLYQSFNCMLYDHSVLLEEAESTEPECGPVVKHRSAIFGQTCDGLDQISKDILLPELRVGDWLAVPSMGAYTNGASSQFNGFPLNDTIILDDHDFSLEGEHSVLGGTFHSNHRWCGKGSKNECNYFFLKSESRGSVLFEEAL